MMMKQRFFKNLFLSVSLGVFSSATFALPPVLQSGIDKGSFKILETFDTGISSLKGYVLTRGDGFDTFVMYGLNDKLLIGGVVFNELGENLTQLHTEKHSPKSDVESFVSKFEKEGLVINVGNKGLDVYAFIDPLNPLTKKFFSQSEPYISTGEVALKVIPVTQDELLVSKIASFASEKDIEGVRAEDFFSHIESIEDPKIPSVSNAKKIKRNSQIAMSSSSLQYPSITFKNASGEWVFISGFTTMDEVLSLARGVGSVR